MFVKCEHINDFVMIYKILEYKNNPLEELI